MKVLCNGKELFEIDFTEPIPDSIEINENTSWGDRWGLFAIMALLNGNVKFNEEHLKEVKDKSYNPELLTDKT